MPKKIRVCQGPHCLYRGSPRLMEVLEKHFGLKAGKSNDMVDLGYCACTDNCDWGPNIVENDKIVYHESRTRDIMERLEKGDGKPITHPTIEDLKLDEDLL